MTSFIDHPRLSRNSEPSGCWPFLYLNCCILWRSVWMRPCDWEGRDSAKHKHWGGEFAVSGVGCEKGFVLGYIHRICHDFVQITPKSWAYTGEKGRAPEKPTVQQLIYPGFPTHHHSFERYPSPLQF